MFDLDLLGIEPNDLKIELHPKVEKEYGRFVGKRLKCAESRQPSREALKKRYKRFCTRIASGA
jgi:hypothetical protein